MHLCMAVQAFGSRYHARSAVKRGHPLGLNREPSHPALEDMAPIAIHCFARILSTLRNVISRLFVNEYSCFGTFRSMMMIVVCVRRW